MVSAEHEQTQIFQTCIKNCRLCTAVPTMDQLKGSDYTIASVLYCRCREIITLAQYCTKLDDALSDLPAGKGTVPSWMAH